MRPPVFQDQLPVTDHGRHRFENVMNINMAGAKYGAMRRWIFWRSSILHPRPWSLLCYGFGEVWHALPMNYVN